MSFGIGELRPCDPARVCTANGACVMPQCQVDMDCLDSAMPLCTGGLCGPAQCALDSDCSAAEPVCVGHRCAAKCTGDMDCTDPAAAKCDADGACVACIDGGECPLAAAPACDGSAHTCRACLADGECASGVCLEYTGECAGSDAILYVSGSGADGAPCTAAQPCKTIAEAVALVTGTKNVVRLETATAPLGVATLEPPFELPVVIDGAPTAITFGSGSAVFDVERSEALTLEGISMAGTVDHQVHFAEVADGAFVVTNSELDRGFVHVNGGTFTATNDVLNVFGADMAAGSTTMDRDYAPDVSITLVGSVVITRNILTGGDALLEALGGVYTIENNLITSTDPFADPITLEPESGSGATFQFNTLVNTSGTDGKGVALECHGAAIATNNIIAWHSSAPSHCPTTYTLFDELATGSGSGDVHQDVSTFFVDLPHGDYHLAPGSPAREMGVPNPSVATDIEGNPRPNPTGTSPDVGAYEAGP